MIFAALFRQSVGINALNIYSTQIIADIHGIKTLLGVYLVSIANLVGCIIGALIKSKFSIRKIIIFGQFMIALSNLLIALF